MTVIEPTQRSPKAAVNCATKKSFAFNGNSTGRDGSGFTAFDLSVQFVIPNVIYRAAGSSCQKSAFSRIDCAIIMTHRSLGKDANEREDLDT